MTGFGVRLADAKAQRGPLCVGIDPHPELLRAWDLPTTADGLAAFCDICIEAFSGFAVVKPQVAFFEAYGAAGFAVLERTIAALRSAGVLVLADAKRGDIGTTMAAYAAAWAGDSPLAADAVTATPTWASARCGRCWKPPRRTTAGVRAGGHLQSRGRDRAACRLRRPHGGPAGRRPGGGGEQVLHAVRARLRRRGGRRDGAQAPDLSALGGPVLVPGLGVQGGRPEALAGLGGADPGQLLPAVAREVLRAGPGVAELRAAADRMLDAVAYLGAL